MRKSRVVALVIASVVASSVITYNVTYKILTEKIKNIEAIAEVFSNINYVSELISIVNSYINDDTSSQEYAYIRLDIISDQFNEGNTKELSSKIKVLSKMVKDETKEDVAIYWQENIAPEIANHFESTKDMYSTE
ncbi:hypothetical protein ACPV3A_29475 [Paenibacillus sp. Dod16]|uniref:hypothetical protein n=1 Tax=Paenibacillus sp. Dod16 TaxID=3416392 RepID=UPI003CFA41A4